MPSLAERLTALERDLTQTADLHTRALAAKRTAEVGMVQLEAKIALVKELLTEQESEP